MTARMASRSASSGCFFFFGLVMFFQDGTTSVKESILAWEVYVVLAFLLTVIDFLEESGLKRRKCAIVIFLMTLMNKSGI